MRHIIALVAITVLTTIACSESDVRARQNQGNACHIQASSIRPILAKEQILTDPILPDFESNCGTIPIFVQIFPPVTGSQIGLSIEYWRTPRGEWLPHSDNPLNPPYTEEIFAAVFSASLEKLTYFKQIDTRASRKISNIVVYMNFDMLEGDWDGALSFGKQRLESYDRGNITPDNLVEQLGIAEYYENSNLKKIICDLSPEYHLECIEGSFNGFNSPDGNSKQLLETPDFGLSRTGTLKFELKPIHNE